MKKFIIAIISALCLILVSSCEKDAYDIVKTADDLGGSYRLDKIVDTFVLDGVSQTNIYYEYIDDGYHDYTVWVFGDNGKLEIWDYEFSSLGEPLSDGYVPHYYHTTSIHPHKCFYRLDGKDLLIFDGPDTQKYTIDKFIRAGHVDNMLNISYEYPYIRHGEKVASVKRTTYLKCESYDNYSYF